MTQLRSVIVLITACSLLHRECAAQTPAEILTRAKTVLSRIDGDVTLPALRQPVEVLRDRWGVPHLYAQNSHDLFFAQGFVVAQDRLFQMDLWRRVGCGELAEVYGESSLAGDRFARLMLYRGDMQAEWTSYSPDTREIATAFTDGINACIDQLGDQLPIEFQVLGYRPKKWRPEDVLTRMSGLIMVSNWEREFARARLMAKVGIEQARRISPTDPPRDFAPDPAVDLNALPTEIMDGFRAATRSLKFSPDKAESNNWVIDGTLSASGKPLLASDPHRSTTLPALRYLVHLNAPGWNVIGAGEPGLPGVAIGHNEHVAWGFTIVGTDQSDLILEETHPCNSRCYKVGDQWQLMDVVQDSVAVKGRAQSVPVELRFTRHGPVIYQDEQKHIAVSLKWVGTQPGTAAYLGSLAVARARDARDLVKSLESWKVPALNFVFADVGGDIGWVAAGLTPIRNHSDGLLPVPGASSKSDWQGFLKVADLPQSLNPARHWVATANHNILPPGYSRQIAFDWSAPYRFQRLEQRLVAQTQFTLDDFQSMQHENTSLLAQALVRLLPETQTQAPAEHAAFVKLLTEWDGVLSRETAAGALYSVWLQELMTRVFQQHFPAELKLERGDLRSQPVLLARLQQPTEDWFGPGPVAARDKLVSDALTAAIARTKSLLGDDPQRWSWGRLHTATFRHPLASLSPAYAQAFNLGPVARPGDVTTPNNTRAGDDFQQIHGASYRQVLDLADWDRAQVTSTPGQSGQLGSPHYGDLLPLWAEARYFPLSYSRRKVEEATSQRLRLQPQP